MRQFGYARPSFQGRPSTFAEGKYSLMPFDRFIGDTCARSCTSHLHLTLMFSIDKRVRSEHTSLHEAELQARALRPEHFLICY